MSTFQSPGTWVAGLAITGLLIFFVRRDRLRRLPPGPRGWPIIGNMYDLPLQGEPVPWLKHKDVYGPISSVTVLGKTIVILNDLQTSIDLLERRSSIYSGRPIFPFAGSLVGWDQQMLLAQYGEHFRTMRKMLKSYLGSPSAVSKFQPIQELETRYFLARILENPANLMTEIRLIAGAISLRISHGYTVETDKADPLVGLVESAAKDFYVATMPGAWMVDFFPIMKCLPKWLPFQQAAAVYRNRYMDANNRPHEFVKNCMKAGTALPSFASHVMSNTPLDENTEHSLKFAATAIYGGGSDPAVAVLSAFILLMILHPDVQKCARDELDLVVGTKRLPKLYDRPLLPYVEAVFKEVMRWHPVARVGIPHRVIQDDIYNGYLIPKDSVILPHIWNITRDPKLYSKPEEFRPERFLAKDGHTPELDVNTYLFGFGRRACPGQDFGNANMFIAMAMLLSVFEVDKGRDENGVEVQPRCEFSGGTVSHPLRFAYSIKPRSTAAEYLILTVLDEFPPRRGDGDSL